MCYSSTISIVTFIEFIIASSILFCFNKVLGVFFAFVGLMQLYDYIFWTNSGSINFWTTKLAMITNNMQPLILAFLIVIFGKKKLKTASLVLVVLYSIATLIYSWNAWNKITVTTVSKKSSPSLHWEWNGLYGYVPYYALYLLTMTVLLYQHIEWPINIIACLLCIVTFVFSSALYTKKGTTGRLWCWMTGLSPLIFVGAYLLIGSM
jgi:hypothetical protein